MEDCTLETASYSWAIERCINDAWSFAEPLLECEFDFPVEVYSAISFCLPYCPLEELMAFYAFGAEGDLSARPDEVSDFVWGILVAEECNNLLDRRIRFYLLLFLLELNNANYHLRHGTKYRSIDSFGEAMLALGEARACFAVQPEAITRANFAKMGALVRLRNDPKQAAKQEVRACWDLWQKEPSRYKGKAAFAKDMLNKYEDLESQPVIARWCKEWESEPSQ